MTASHNNLRFLLIAAFCLFISQDLMAQTCVPGNPLTAPAGGTADAAPGLRVFNSPEVSGNTVISRAAVDTLDDEWRVAAAGAASGTPQFITYNLTGPAQLQLPVLNLFGVGALQVGIDFREFADITALDQLCVGADVTNLSTFGFRDNNTLIDRAPRPASFYLPGNQPREIFDTVSLPTLTTLTRGAVVYNFTSSPRAFGAYYGDLDTRTDGDGTPATVRLLDAAGNRIGEDIYIEPRAVDQADCSTVILNLPTTGCGNETTRFIGFVDTAASPRVRKMVVTLGTQSLTGSLINDFGVVAPTVVPNATTAANVTVGGRVSSGKSGVSKAVVYLTNQSGRTRSVTTDFSGSFNFDNVPAGGSYVVNVFSKRYNFAPQFVSVSEDVTDLIFTPQQTFEAANSARSK